MRSHGSGDRYLGFRKPGKPSSIDFRLITTAGGRPDRNSPADFSVEVGGGRTMRIVGEVSDRFFDKVTVLGTSDTTARVVGYDPIYEGTEKPPEYCRDQLICLGDAMKHLDLKAVEPTRLSAAHTYIGQFIAHDISDMTTEKGMPKNLSTAALDLDGVLGTEDDPWPGPWTMNSRGGNRCLDLPRIDRMALIADPRNDHNLALAQVHNMIARFHLHVCSKCKGNSAYHRQITRNFFQYAVLNDFLPRIVGHKLFKQVTESERRAVMTYAKPGFVLPLEFALAFFRFGHAMVRGTYSHWTSDQGAPASTQSLFDRTGGGSLRADRDPPLEDNWAMQWEHMLEGVDPNVQTGLPLRPSPIGPGLTKTMRELPQEISRNPICPRDKKLNIAVETLLRGAELDLPSAQQLARHLGVSTLDLEKKSGLAAALEHASQPLVDALEQKKGAYFIEHTPLWLFTLLEAKAIAGGMHLGPLAGLVVAETLHAAIAADEQGILGASYGFDPEKNPAWERSDKFDFAAMARCAASIRPPCG